MDQESEIKLLLLLLLLFNNQHINMFNKENNHTKIYFNGKSAMSYS